MEKLHLSKEKLTVAKKMLNIENKCYDLRVVGNSMYPTYCDQQIVKVLPIECFIKFNDIKRGVVVVFQREKSYYIIHRICFSVMFRKKRYFKTKGDHCFKMDSFWIKEEDIIGVVI